MIPIRNFKGWLAAVIFLTAFIIIRLTGIMEKETPYCRNEGIIFSTIYHITYKSNTDYRDSIEALLKRFDNSVSPFNGKSLITAINSGDTAVRADKWIKTLIERSAEISQATGGAFDPTVSPLVNLWGFGYKKGLPPDKASIDTVMKYVGMKNITLHPDGRVEKSDSSVTLNFSAIAKGYAVDLTAEYLRSKGITDYLVEIGGEIVASGHNPVGKKWSVGIDTPSDTATTLQRVIHADKLAMATSGNYRNYKTVNGRRVWHTIDPRTGQPAQNTLLSATVLASDCMTADAYATAFMVLGIDESRKILAATPGLEALLIYAVNDTAAYGEYMTDGFKKMTKDE